MDDDLWWIEEWLPRRLGDGVNGAWIDIADLWEMRTKRMKAEERERDKLKNKVAEREREREREISLVKKIIRKLKEKKIWQRKVDVANKI